VKILVDMNLSPRLARALTVEGIEAVHWSVVGVFDAPDSDLMRYARQHGFSVLTHDMDFGAMLAANGGQKPSVIQIRADDLGAEGLAKQIAATLRFVESELEAGALVTVEPGKTRLRLLPLK